MEMMTSQFHPLISIGVTVQMSFQNHYLDSLNHKQQLLVYLKLNLLNQSLTFHSKKPVSVNAVPVKNLLVFVLKMQLEQEHLK